MTISLMGINDGRSIGLSGFPDISTNLHGILVMLMLKSHTHVVFLQFSYHKCCRQTCMPDPKGLMDSILWPPSDFDMGIQTTRIIPGFLAHALAGMLVSHWLHLHPIDIVKTIIQSLTIGHRFLFHNLGFVMSERGMLILKSKQLPINFSFDWLPGLMCCLVLFKKISIVVSWILGIRVL